MNQRFDYRTKEEFKKDIKNSHLIELEIALRLCEDYNNLNNIWPRLIPNGTDFTGEFADKAKGDADFLINRS